MTTLSYQSCHLCQTHYQLHLLVPAPQHLKTLTLMIFPGGLKSWKRKHRSLKPGNFHILGVETEQFLLVTKNLHEIPFHLLTVTEHNTPPLGSLPAPPDSAAFQFSVDPETNNWRLSRSSWLLAAVLVRFLSEWSQVSSWPVPWSLHRSVRGWGSTVGRPPKMAGQWERARREASQPRVEVPDLETNFSVQGDYEWESRPQCVFSHSRMQVGERKWLRTPL